jgi:hypothetical protein
LPTESEAPSELEQLTYETPARGDACEVEDVNYQVYADILRSRSSAKSATQRGALLVTVSESTSVVDCGEDLVRIASPGAELTRASYPSSSDSFAFDMASAIIGGHRPSLHVAALLDENDNGLCDDGELTASIEADGEQLDHLQLALTDEGCPRRQ